MTDENDRESTNSISSPFINSSHSSLKHTPFDGRKGIVFGAIAGFVAAIAFTGTILFMSSLFHYPEGAFFDSIGVLILNESTSVYSIGLSSLALVLIQGIIIGIIFGLISSKVKVLNITSKSKGVGFGLLSGIISYVVLFLPMVYWSSIYHNLFTKTISLFASSTFLTIRGTEGIISTNIPLEGILAWGLISYLVYGFIMGGIVTLAYSVYNYDRNEIQKGENQG